MKRTMPFVVYIVLGVALFQNGYAQISMFNMADPDPDSYNSGIIMIFMIGLGIVITFWHFCIYGKRKDIL